MTHQNVITRRQTRESEEPFSDLESLFEALPDDDLVEALEATRWTGRPGYPIRVMWRTLVASFYLGIIHDTDLVRALRSNPLLAATCGIDSRDGVPTKYAYCRFRKKLIGFNDLVEGVLSSCVDLLHKTVPGFGRTIAVDSTDLKAWANGLHQDTDPDAGTGAKHKSSRRVFWYGYKAHVAVDADSELPVSFHVTKANVYDGAHLPKALQEAKRQFDWFAPEYVLADKGYDSKECFRFIGEEMNAIPVIDVQKGRIGRVARESRDCEAHPVSTPDGIRYRCERLPFDPKCSRFGKCPLLPIFVDSPMNPLTRQTYFERFSPFPYGSPEWQVHYNKRVSVERTFSRLKTYRKLNEIRTRRMAKVWLHVALSILVMNASAVAKMQEGRPDQIRECARKVA